MEAPENRKRLIFSLLRLMSDDSNRCSDDVRESLEVAMQCIGEVYGVSLDDESQSARLGVAIDLQNVFDREASANVVLTDEQRLTAQALKEKGNQMIHNGDFKQAVEMYTQAIAIDRNNAIFYANRAAAYMKLQQHQMVIKDCQAAIRIDPSYSKAHSRLGNAHSALGQHAEAVKAFQKAVELDPNNKSYREGLEAMQAEIASKEGGGAAGSAPGAAGAGGMPRGMGDLGGLDIGSMVNNPNFMSMATNLINTPGFANMAANMFQGGGASGMGGANFMQTAQQLAEQVQTANPDFMDQMRGQVGGDPSADGGAGAPGSSGTGGQ